MSRYKNIWIPTLSMILLATACSKLDQKLGSTLTSGQAVNALGANGPALLLQTAYNDLGNPYADPGNILALEEVTADECVVPTRAGDWDDAGKWRALKKHAWSTDNVDIILAMFNALNKLNFDATNVLAFKPSNQQKAEARFLRAVSLYQLLDLFGQYPVREPGENLLNAPKVYTGDSAVLYIINELEEALPDLPASTTMDKASQDAANFLLMRLYLNRGAFVNRENPTFADEDMQQVISLGTALMNSGRYSYESEYFDNFNPNNSGTSEGIFASPNQAGVATNNTAIHNRWWSTLHYNQYTPRNPQAGWNGFSTVADFYNSFGVTTPATQTPKDTALDNRIGGRFYRGCTDISGVRPGLLIGQQYNEKGEPEKDRNGLPLIFVPTFSEDLKETGANLEVVGIRVVKYVPDYSNNGANYSNTAGNWTIHFRYPDVVLMVAEAKMRAASPDNQGALDLVNEIRTARKAEPLTTMTLVNPNFVADAKTLLAERGRELYWEVVRRTDLIRYGVFLKEWALKPASSPTYLLFPIPSSALAANPNLKQNPGYN